MMSIQTDFLNNQPLKETVVVTSPMGGEVSSEALTLLLSQKFLPFLKPEDFYNIDNSLSLDPIPNQLKYSHPF